MLSVDMSIVRQCSHSLALLFNPLVLLLKVHHSGGVARLFLHEGLNIMLKLFDHDFHIGSHLLLHLDGLVQVVQLRIIPCQRCLLNVLPAVGNLPWRAPSIILISVGGVWCARSQLLCKIMN
jgi:hypothetical protein